MTKPIFPNCDVCGRQLNYYPEKEDSFRFDQKRFEAPAICSNECYDIWPLKDGQPCSHAGCLSHVSHPCEGCGRIAGCVVHQDTISNIPLPITRLRTELVEQHRLEKRVSKIYTKKQIESLACPCCSGELTVMAFVRTYVYCDGCSYTGEGSAPHSAYVSLFNKMW